MKARTRIGPLTPQDSEYLGLDADGWHQLRWHSQTRADVTHTTYYHDSRHEDYCTCEGFAHRRTCKHAACLQDALRHHLGEPPPADPGGAVGEPPESAGLSECEDAARNERKRRYTESMANLYGN